MKTLTLEQFDQRTKTFDSDLRGSMYAVREDWGEFKPSRGRRRVEVKKGKIQHNKQQRIKAAKAKQAAAVEAKKIDRLKKDRGNNKYLDLALSEYEADCAILGTQPVTMYNARLVYKRSLFSRAGLFCARIMEAIWRSRRDCWSARKS